MPPSDPAARPPVELLMERLASRIGHQVIELDSRAITAEIAAAELRDRDERIAELEQDVEDLRSQLEAAEDASAVRATEAEPEESAGP